jgi:hypothetical protein
MDRLPAITGWHWVKQGFALFRKQPMEMSTLFLAYMFFTMASGIIPVLGQILPLILVPVFSMSFMQACIQLEQGKRIYPNVLLSGFRLPAFRSLLVLGVLYLFAAIAAVAGSALIDGGMFWQVMTGQMMFDAETLRDSNSALIFAAFLFTPALMAFWYAAPLIAWQNMGVGKALFYSFFAVYRAGRAYLVYGLAWALIGVLLPVFLSVFIATIFSSATLVVAVLLPLSLIMTVIMYCSFYPTYTTIFGPPPEAAKIAATPANER